MPRQKSLTAAPVAAGSAAKGAKAVKRIGPKKQSGLDQTGTLVMASLKRYRRDWRLLAGTAAMVSLPLSLASVSNALIDDAGFNAYAGIATFIAGLALMTAIMSPHAGKGRIRAAYYRGTGAFVRLVVVAVILAAWALAGFTVLVAELVWGALLWLRARLVRALAPRSVSWAALVVAAVLSFGLVLVAASVNLFAWVIVSYSTVFIFQLGPLIVGLSVAVIILPLLLLAVRNCYVLPLLVDTELSPVALLSRSRELVRSRFWATAGRLAAMTGLAFIGLLLTLAVALPLGLAVRFENVPQAFFQLILGVVIMPIALVYIAELYKGARDHAARA